MLQWKIAEDKGSKQFFLIVWNAKSLYDCVYGVINNPEITSAVENTMVGSLDYNNALFNENDNGTFHAFYYLNPAYM